MSNSTNQNATASWSGYSHQGQVGLLVAIKKMIELNSLELDLANYFVEFEKEEDAAVYKIENDTKEYISIHQVKAKYSSGSKKLSKYAKAIKEFSTTICSEKYLHTSLEIDNWSSTTEINPENVSRYEYEDGVTYCDTSKIDDYLILELKKILGENETGGVEIALNRISNELDQRIRKEHKEKNGVKKEMNVVLCLEELYQSILDKTDFNQELLCSLRRKLIKYYHEFLRDIVFQTDEFCDEDDLPLGFTKILEDIFFLEDNPFGEFLKLLDLSKDQNDYDLHSLDRNGVIDVFYLALFNAHAGHRDSTLENESVSYTLEKDSYSRLITSINTSKNREGRVAENYLRNWKLNVLKWEPHYIINKEIKGKLIEIAPDIKPRTIGMAEQVKNDAFMRSTNESSFITIDDAKDELDNE
jgi:hypothetical protein